MCILPIYSNSHSSVQTVDGNKRTNYFWLLSQSLTNITSQTCVTPHNFFTFSEATSLMCISLIYSNSHCSVQTVDRNERTTAFDSYHRASQTSHLKFASHFTVFPQLVRLPHSFLFCPYFQLAIAQSRRSIESNGQRRSAAITKPQKHHFSNLRRISFFYNQWGYLTGCSHLRHTWNSFRTG